MNRIQEIIDRKYKDKFQKPNYPAIVKEMDIAISTLRSYRLNITQPSFYKLPQIASVLGVEIKDLIKTSGSE